MSALWKADRQIFSSHGMHQWQRYLLLLLPKEREQIGVHHLVMGRKQPVRQAWIDFQLGALDQLRRHHRGRADWDDLIVVAVDDQRRQVEFLEIFREISFGEGL